MFFLVALSYGCYVEGAALSGAALCEPQSANFVARAALREPRSADFVASAALREPRSADFVAGQHLS